MRIESLCRVRPGIRAKLDTIIQPPAPTLPEMPETPDSPGASVRDPQGPPPLSRDLRQSLDLGQPPAVLPPRALAEPGIRDIPGGYARPDTSSIPVSITRTMITEHLCSYAILYLRQEKGFRDRGVTRTGLRVMLVRPSARSAARRRRQPPSTVIIVSKAALPHRALSISHRQSRVVRQ